MADANLGTNYITHVDAKLGTNYITHVKLREVKGMSWTNNRFFISPYKDRTCKQINFEEGFGNMALDISLRQENIGR